MQDRKEVKVPERLILVTMAHLPRSVLQRLPQTIKMANHVLAEEYDLQPAILDHERLLSRGVIAAGQLVVPRINPEQFESEAVLLQRTHVVVLFVFMSSNPLLPSCAHRVLLLSRLVALERDRQGLPLPVDDIARVTHRLILWSVRPCKQPSRHVLVAIVGRRPAVRVLGTIWGRQTFKR